MKRKRRGTRHTLGLVNVVGSTIAREAGAGIYLHAGPEIGVASTKAFTSQVVALAMFTLKLGRLKALSSLRGSEIIHALEGLPGQVKGILDRAHEIEELAEEFKRAQNFLYLGRGYNFPTALEGALKLKEISYIHAEGYPAAEMKHGPIALIDEMMPVVFIAPHDSVFDKVVSNVQEVKARRGTVIAITSRDEPSLKGKLNYEFRIPETIDMLTADPWPGGAIATARLPRRGEARRERRSAAQSGQVGHGRVVEHCARCCSASHAPRFAWVPASQAVSNAACSYWSASRTMMAKRNSSG